MSLRPHVALVAFSLGIMMLAACTSTPPAPKTTTGNPAQYHFAPRPTVPAPPVKVFHQDNDTYTLTTKPDATDDEISAILWQLRDAAHNHTFAALHLDQTFIDARKPTVWFHIYRGPRCASEKFTRGPLPCEASYHGAGDYTLGGYHAPQWEDAILHHPDGSETHLWDPDAPYTPAAR